MNGTLKEGEPHPSAYIAMDWIKSLPVTELMAWRESFASVLLSSPDNRYAEVCSETLRRIMDGEPVSDRYVLGLAWGLYFKEEKNEEN